ncbi:ribosome recycling factor [Labilibaculum sp. K2S]|uniref:ribosome recycling factor n=1 Tax=Labilibaculum sp. K2S TaxID=3056386 RepID=UPI0025A3DA93|nr:ribosome recycling factor [Labilibaculum sp. K2S]MDM8159303.1 ribosome recycling factor [Labilibaculum sp. K2S]
MNEEVQMYLDDTQERMEAAVDHLEKELVKIRAGRANPSMLNGVMVDYYGSMTPLAQVANLSVPDPRTIAIQPWEKPMIVQIEKAIMNSNLGFNPDNNGELIRIHIPPLTEERRNDLVKQAKAECEHAKVSVRNARRDTNVELKKLVKEGLSEDVEKDAEAIVQKLTDKYSKTVDDLLIEKEKDIMTI